MTDERDEILGELRALIAVEPSFEFERRVRSSVERSSSRMRSWWPWIVAGTATVAVAVAVAIQVQQGTVAPAAKAVSLAAPALAAPPEPRQHRVVLAPEVTRSQMLHAATRRARPEVLVPPDQALALQRVMAAVQEGNFIWAPEAGKSPSAVVDPLPEIPALSIEALPGGPDDGQLGTDSDSQRVENHASRQQA